MTSANRWDNPVKSYLAFQATQHSEPARSHRFTVHLRDLFGVQPRFIEDYIDGLEQYVEVKQKDHVVRARGHDLSKEFSEEEG